MGDARAGSFSPSEHRGASRLATTHHWALPSSHGVIFPYGVLTSAALSRTLVTRSLFVLFPISHHGPNLEVFAPHSLEKYLSRVHPPLGLYSPTEFHRAIPCSFAKSCNCSPGVQPPSAFSDIRSPLTLGLPHPVRCAYRFSQPPSAFLLRTPPGTISAGNAHGVRPPEPFPCNQPGHPLGATCLHAVSSLTRARLQGLGPTAEPPLLLAGLRHEGVRCSPGLYPLQGFHPSRTRPLGYRLETETQTGPSSH
jgi:hypothetical protein